MAVTKKRSASTTTVKPRVKSAARNGTTSARMSLAEAMAVLEKAGSAQTKKTYLRHGAKEPLFGASFATLKDLLKRIGVDHDLACALWDTGNYDARNLAVKIADPAKMKAAGLDRWAHSTSKGFESPAAHERSRESMRLCC